MQGEVPRVRLAGSEIRHAVRGCGGVRLRRCTPASGKPAEPCAKRDASRRERLAPRAPLLPYGFFFLKKRK
jgi:hypothetical protein